MATKPIIAFVPGAYHEPLAYDLLLPSLHLAGYQTTAISLPSVRGPSNMTDFGPDVAAIRNVVGGLVELGREVVVVSHSYGGTPATEAMRGLGKKQREAQGLLGGVVQLIYIAAGVPLEGENFAQSIVNTSDTDSDPIYYFYHDLLPEIARYYAALVQPQAREVFFTPLTYAAYRDIPAAYLFTTEDRAIRIDIQKRIVKKTGIKVTGALPTSHSPFLSRPEAVVRFIRAVVEGWWVSTEGGFFGID